MKRCVVIAVLAESITFVMLSIGCVLMIRGKLRESDPLSLCTLVRYGTFFCNLDTLDKYFGQHGAKSSS